LTVAAPERKHLLVEGADDRYAIAQLMGSHVQWGNKKAEWPVTIDVAGSADEMLAPGYISTQLKSREVEILGILIDADEVLAARWAAIRSRCQGQFPEIPDELPQEGLVLQNASGKRLGIWIMPDNISRGMLESFLRFLVPVAEAVIWQRAQNAVQEAINAGAKCRECHRDKANIHTWLAWQDPPGQAFGNAIVMSILDPQSPYAAPFVDWFKRLYEL
jgi:hypothetical protein